MSACLVCDAPLKSYEEQRHFTACMKILHAMPTPEVSKSLRRGMFGRRAVAFESDDGSVAFDGD